MTGDAVSTPPLDLSGMIDAATGRHPVEIKPLGGSTGGGRVVTARLDDGEIVVAKVHEGVEDGVLHIEGAMLSFLRAKSKLPVPEVVHARPNLLVMEYVASSGGLTEDGQAEAAEMIAALHAITDARYGFPQDTVIGGLKQVNRQGPDWRRFFAGERLVHMGMMARGPGGIDARTLARIERLAGNLERWIKKPNRPSLLHGDLWGGNVLCRDGRVAAFIDPAIYYGDAEIELAFTTLFGTFGEAFFDRYDAINPIQPGFFEERRDLYNLYPLLVHVRLFGGSYVMRVERTLDKFGV